MHSFRLSPGFEPWTPHSQWGALPIKLKTTLVAGAGFEPTPSVSKTDMQSHYTTRQLLRLSDLNWNPPPYESGMLPLHQVAFCGSYGNRTRLKRSKISCPTPRRTDQKKARSFWDRALLSWRSIYSDPIRLCHGLLFRLIISILQSPSDIFIPSRFCCAMNGTSIRYRSENSFCLNRIIFCLSILFIKKPRNLLRGLCFIDLVF